MASETNEISDIVKKCKILLLDIEGTTTSISFVKDKLFPYAAANVKAFLESQWEYGDVKETVVALRKLAVEDKDKNVEGVVTIPGEDASKEEQIEGLVKSVEWLMSADRKVGPLKQLQGLIWKQGYDKGDIKGHVYDDVAPALELWRSTEGQKVYIYSSGSVQAQKLLFNCSVAGDLLPHIEGHFDTAVGAKQEAASYAAIVEKVGCKPEEILFLTDIVKEAEAARASGLQAALVSREGNAPLPSDATTSYPVLHSFDQLTVSNKRKKDPQEEEVPAKVPKTDIDADVKTATEMEITPNTAAPSENIAATDNKTTETAKHIVEHDKMEVEEDIPVAETPNVEQVAKEFKNVEEPVRVETAIEKVTDSNEAGNVPVCNKETVIEESVDKTEKNETEMMETEYTEDIVTVETAIEPKPPTNDQVDEPNAFITKEKPAKETINDQSGPIAEEMPAKETINEQSAPIAEEMPAKGTINDQSAPIAEEMPAEETINEQSAPIAEEMPAKETINQQSAPVTEEKPANEKIDEQSATITEEPVKIDEQSASITEQEPTKNTDKKSAPVIEEEIGKEKVDEQSTPITDEKLGKENSNEQIVPNTEVKSVPEKVDEQSAPISEEESEKQNIDEQSTHNIEKSPSPDTLHDVINNQENATEKPVPSSVTGPDVKNNEEKDDKETTTSVITVEDVTNTKESLSDAEIVDVVPVVEEPPAIEMDDLKNVGDVLEKECDEILSKVQDVTNLDTMPVKPMLNSIAEEPMESENDENTNDIVERILDSEMEVAEKSSENIEDIKVPEIKITKADGTEENDGKMETIVDEASVDKNEKSAGNTAESPKVVENGNAKENKDTVSVVESKKEIDQRIGNNSSTETVTEEVNTEIAKVECVPPLPNREIEDKMDTTDSLPAPISNVLVENNKEREVSLEPVESKTAPEASSDVPEDVEMESKEDTTEIEQNKADTKENITETKHKTELKENITEPEQHPGELTESIKEPADKKAEVLESIAVTVNNKPETIENIPEPVENKVEANEILNNEMETLDSEMVSVESSVKPDEKKEIKDSDAKLEENKTEIKESISEQIVDGKESENNICKSVETMETENAKPVDNQSDANTQKENKIEESIAEPDIAVPENNIVENNKETKEKHEPVAEVITETKDKVSEDVSMKTEVTETQVNGKTNGEPEVKLNGNASKDEELSARLSVENGSNGKEMNGSNGNSDSNDVEKGQGDNKVEPEVADIKVKTVSSEEPRTDPIEQPVEA